MSTNLNVLRLHRDNYNAMKKVYDDFCRTSNHGLVEGQKVEVVRGRKIPKGITGKLLRWGENSYGRWVLIEFDGNQVFTAMHNVIFPNYIAEMERKAGIVEVAKDQYQAALKEAVVFVGIDLNNPIEGTSKLEQYAWHDSYTATYAVNPEASDELIHFVLDATLDPSESSWGKLRWSSGSSIVDRPTKDRVVINSTTCLCD